VIKKQTEQLAIPRLLQVSIRDICFLQHRFTQRHGVRPHRVIEHPRYRAAYDLLMLRSQTGEHVEELYDWWTRFFSADPAQRERLMKEVSKSRPSKKRRKPRKFSRKAPIVKPEQL
jgi:poly(A) polymerase